MRNRTMGAILKSCIRIPEIPAAFFSQCIQGTITEQTVEIVRIHLLMTWKKFTFFMTKKRVFLTLAKLFLHIAHLPKKEVANVL